MSKEIEKRILTSLILIPLTFFFIYKGSFFFIFFLIITFFISSYEWIKMSKKKKLIKLFGIIFLFLSFYFAYVLRLEHGFKIFLFIILISILTDIGGYIFGKTFKGPKLTNISPKKTYAGLIGSFVLSLIGGLIFVEFMNNFIIDIEFNFISFEPIEIRFNLFLLLFISIVSLVSQAGDLVVSYFKRIAKIKDTGKILPGHGGLLDRIDGIIFVIPFAYIYLKLTIIY
ncbi:phosphatidate cytidylyltransferase [Candidatus Pelagibacter sp.]|nr:phosphatidate cytidylyltransferase [Candidatus Pelagibacter sp.]